MKEPYVKNIFSELESLQHEVSGDIEVVYPFADPVGLICNDEGKLNGMELNRAMRMEDGQIYDIMAGKFLVVGLTEDSFRSLTEDEISKFTALYQQPEIFARLNGEIVAIPVEPRVEPERSAENTYELFQLKDAPETREYRFESMEHLKRRGLELNPDLYEKVYAVTQIHDQTNGLVITHWLLSRFLDWRMSLLLLCIQLNVLSLMSGDILFDEFLLKIRSKFSAGYWFWPVWMQIAETAATFFHLNTILLHEDFFKIVQCSTLEHRLSNGAAKEILLCFKDSGLWGKAFCLHLLISLIQSNLTFAFCPILVF